jgi:cytochrome c oxidase assembly protein subunit 15
LIIAGGLVTSTGSGLSVPDWPLSYGRFFPPMIGGIRFEHSHRVIAGFVGLLSLGLMAWVLKRDPRKSARFLSVLAFLTVVVQALLGGLTVLYLLPVPISVFHACLAQTFFCMTASLATLTSREWLKAVPLENEHAQSLRRLLTVTTAFAFLQLVLGAVVRHTHGLLVTYHIVLGFILLLHLLAVVLKISHEQPFRERFFGHAVFLGILILIQIFLGFGAFIFKLMLAKQTDPGIGGVFFATLHQSAGALVLAACLVLTLRVYRLFR